MELALQLHWPEVFFVDWSCGWPGCRWSTSDFIIPDRGGRQLGKDIRGSGIVKSCRRHTIKGIG
jgi:hypothetical protein